jgi:hypothetical protein
MDKEKNEFATDFIRALYPKPRKASIWFRVKSYLRVNSKTKLVLIEVAIHSFIGSILACTESTKNFFANSITNLDLDIIDLARPALTPTKERKRRYSATTLPSANARSSPSTP